MIQLTNESSTSPLEDRLDYASSHALVQHKQYYLDHCFKIFSRIELEFSEGFIQPFRELLIWQQSNDYYFINVQVDSLVSEFSKGKRILQFHEGDLEVTFFHKGTGASTTIDIKVGAMDYLIDVLKALVHSSTSNQPALTIEAQTA